MDIAPCPDKWLAYKGKCYRVNMDDTDYYNARRWCKDQNSTLVSINDAEENNFVWKICYKDKLPIAYGRNESKATCWLGMSEKGGDVNTPQDLQKWEWLDGTTVKGNKFDKWALRPGMGNGDGDGNRYYEPNNERTARTPGGDDVRHAIMNQQEGGMMGKWYDKPAQFRAHAVCEMTPEPMIRG